MAEYFKGTLLASPIVRGSSGDTYGTHHSVLGVGGYMEVKTLVERNLLPVDDVNKIGYDNISSGQRRIGMLVYVHEEDKIYQLKIDKILWDGLDIDGKMNALADNANWVEFKVGEGSGDRIEQTFTQANHQFNIGDVIGHNGTQFVKVDNTTAKTIEPLGVISKVIDLNTFTINYSGYINISGVTDSSNAPLNNGTVYYLSNVVGKVTSTEPTELNVVSKPILVTLNNNVAIVLQYRGFENGADEGVDWDTFTGYTATTQQQLDNTITGGTNLGFFEGKTGVQILPITDLNTTNGVDYSGNYKSVYNNFYRDSDGVIQIGIPDDGIPRRGYVREEEPTYSWIWDEYLQDSTSATSGWVIIEGDVTSPDVYGKQYTNTILADYLPLYNNNVWLQNQSYNNGSNIVIGTVLGSLLTGDTYTEGGPILSDDGDDQTLKLRTIVSDTPELIHVTYDDYYIRLSGSSANKGENLGDGKNVFVGKSGDTFYYRSIKGAGDTVVSVDEGNIIITTNSDGVAGSGSTENVTKRIVQSSHGFYEGTAVGLTSGGVYSRAIANGTYDGEIIGIVSNRISEDVFDLTQSGFITGISGNYTAGETYYVSTINAGDIITTKPTTVGHIVRPIFVAKTTDSGWVLPYQGYEIIDYSGGTGGGNEYYTGRTPSSIALGGIAKNTTLTGKTYSQLFQELLVPTITPTYVSPSNLFSDTASPYYEVGCTIGSITFTSSFNRGEIRLDGHFQNYRSGQPNHHLFSGTDLTTSVPSTDLSESQTITNYTVMLGNQYWGACVQYDEGPQPYDSNNDPYGTPLPAGTTSEKRQGLEGVYPLYATCSSISSLSKISTLYSMLNGNLIEIDLVSETGGYKQKFEIPTEWVDNRSLHAVAQFDTATEIWKYPGPGGTPASSLSIWDVTTSVETVQGSVINYYQYTYNVGADRGDVKIRLEF